MKNERIFLADDKTYTLESLQRGIEIFGEADGHKVIGKATSVSDVEKQLEQGLKPTVALVDNSFPNVGDGRGAAEIIKKFSPETFVISLSTDKDVTWGQENWSKRTELRKLIKALTDLQH